jgi:hypothetical protein
MIPLKPQITQSEIELIQELIEKHPSWGRTRLSIELCNLWGWHHQDGCPKEIACRDLLRKLDFKGLIKLPQKIKNTGLKPKSKNHIQLILHDTTEVLANIKDILPVCIEVIKKPASKGHTFKSLIDQYHYLGFDMSVGENLKYMVYSAQGQLLACLLFGSSAWSCASRDAFIGWNAKSRRANLIYTTNNTRFLILPWVKVEHLASHILGLICKRIASDWQTKYGHELYLLETFVEKSRFRGTCYKAANWVCVGQTKGRSRNDRYNKLKVPIKDIYLYPLSKNFREVLCSESLT